MKSDFTKTVTIVDPPGGWRYGFPAILQNDYLRQLRNAGYPEQDIEIALKYSRYWTQEIDYDMASDL